MTCIPLHVLERESKLYHQERVSHHLHFVFSNGFDSEYAAHRLVNHNETQCMNRESNLMLNQVSTVLPNFTVGDALCKHIAAD
jgi:hypothetical protein